MQETCVNAVCINPWTLESTLPLSSWRASYTLSRTYPHDMHQGTTLIIALQLSLLAAAYSPSSWASSSLQVRCHSASSTTHVFISAARPCRAARRVSSTCRQG
jgi:hypothetical protein